MSTAKMKVILIGPLPNFLKMKCASKFNRMPWHCKDEKEGEDTRGGWLWSAEKEFKGLESMWTYNFCSPSFLVVQSVQSLMKPSYRYNEAG
jgi:hypothetical protein